MAWVYNNSTLSTWNVLDGHRDTANTALDIYSDAEGSIQKERKSLQHDLAFHIVKKHRAVMLKTIMVRNRC